MSTEASIRSALEEAHENLSRLLSAMNNPDGRDKLTLLGRVRESMNGWPRSGRLDGQRGGQRSEDVTMPYATGDAIRPAVQVLTNVPVPRNDPTGEAAIRPDPAKADWDTLAKGITRIAREADKLLDLAARYKPRDPNAIEVLEEAVDGCVSCARVPGPGHVGLPKAKQVPFFSEVYARPKLADGSELDLCRYCYDGCTDGARWTGQIPPVGAVEAHRDGRKWRKSA